MQIGKLNNWYSTQILNKEILVISNYDYDNINNNYIGFWSLENYNLISKFKNIFTNNIVN